MLTHSERGGFVCKDFCFVCR
uniref:Uncharacterized protein n=1 Tax=Arundo donax TaxID=35708 RepID=A0A0A9C342_ARUDO